MLFDLLFLSVQTSLNSVVKPREVDTNFIYILYRNLYLPAR